MSCVTPKAAKKVKPLLSLNPQEAHRRVLNLYKVWYRQIPYLLNRVQMPKNEKQCVKKLREKFYKNAKVTDIRVMDLLVIKGHMELEEAAKRWSQKGYLMSHWEPTIEPKPKTFVDKFIQGVD